MRRKNSRSHGTVIWRQLDRKTLQRLQLTFSLFSQNIYGSKHSIETRYFSFKSQQNQILQKSLALTHLIQECVVSIWPSIRDGGGILICTRDQSILLFLILTPSSSPSSSSPSSFSVPHHTLLPSIFNFPFLGSQVEASDIDMNLHLYLPLHNCTCTIVLALALAQFHFAQHPTSLTTKSSLFS